MQTLFGRPWAGRPICRRCRRPRQCGSTYENGPANRGHLSWIEIVKARSCGDCLSRKARRVCASETKTGEVAVANGDLAARHQQAVDRGHQTAEQRAGRKEADGCSLGHGCPLSEVAEQLRFAIRGNLCIPDTRSNALVCIAAIDWVHRSKNEAIGIPHEKRPPEPGGLGIPEYQVAYSAACFRGGASAPESWISAT